MPGQYGDPPVRPCGRRRLPHNLHVVATGPAGLRTGTQLLEATFKIGDPGGQAADVGPLPVALGTGSAPAADPVAAAGVTRLHRRGAIGVGASGTGFGPAGAAGEGGPGDVALRAAPPEAPAALLRERGRMTAVGPGMLHGHHDATASNDARTPRRGGS